MKSTGVVRKVDELGRIVLPIRVRRALDIVERDEVEIYLEDDKIVLRKCESACVFCASTKGLETFEGKHVCMECISKLGKL